MVMMIGAPCPAHTGPVTCDMLGFWTAIGPRSVLAVQLIASTLTVAPAVAGTMAPTKATGRATRPDTAIFATRMGLSSCDRAPTRGVDVATRERSIHNSSRRTSEKRIPRRDCLSRQGGWQIGP